MNDSETRKKALLECDGLPEKNTIVILPDGTILIDNQNPVAEEDLGEQAGEEILCG